MDKSKFDQILERLPYSDGTGRRRFVAGGILLIGLAIIHWRELGGFLGAEMKILDLLKSPTLLVGSVLIIYAIGMIIELIGEIFLIRAASGVFWGVSFPLKAIQPRHEKGPKTYLKESGCFLVLIFATPVLALYGIFRGFFGKSYYSINLHRKLSSGARTILKTLPPKIRDGLRIPVGKDSGLALKYITEEFKRPKNVQWAKKLVVRTRDVSIVTTTLLLLVLYWMSSSTIESSNGQTTNPLISEIEQTVDNFQRDSDMDRSEDYLTQAYNNFNNVVKDWETSKTNFKRAKKEFEQVISTLEELKNAQKEKLSIYQNTLLQEMINRIKESIEFFPKLTDYELGSTLEQFGNMLQNFIDSSTLSKGYYQEIRQGIAAFKDPETSIDYLQEYIGNINNYLKRADNEKITPLFIEMLNQIKPSLHKLVEEHEIKMKNITAKNLKMTLSVLPFLFLYIGFFVILKQTIWTILEALAVEPAQSETVEAQNP